MDVVKVRLDSLSVRTFLILTKIQTECLSQELLLTRGMRERTVCLPTGVHVCIPVNPPPSKHVAFSLETRNFTATT